MHLILTGATGLVGSAVLHHMLNTKTITTISILSRRPVPQAEGHPQARVYIHKDFNTYPSELLEKLSGAEGCVWALGVSTNDVPDEKKYTEISYDYPLAAAKAFSTLSSPFKFVYVSGEGAATTPGRLTPMFGRVKGRAEAALLAASKTEQYASLKPYSLRPGGIDTKFHPEIHPWMPPADALSRRVVDGLLMPVLRFGLKDMVSPTRDLARVLTDLAMGDGEPLAAGRGIVDEGRTVENKGMRRLAGIAS